MRPSDRAKAKGIITELIHNSDDADDISALKYAVASIDAWDKVKEDIKKLSQSKLTGEEEYDKAYRAGLARTWDYIEKRLNEI